MFSFEAPASLGAKVMKTFNKEEDYDTSFNTTNTSESPVLPTTQTVDATLQSQFSFDAPATIGSALIPKEEEVILDELSIALQEAAAGASDTETIKVTFEVLSTQHSVEAKATYFRVWFHFRTHRYIFSGSIAQNIPAFTATARLGYRSLSQLIGWKHFGGVVGPTSFRLNLLDGVTITGNLTKSLGCKPKVLFIVFYKFIQIVGATSILDPGRVPKVEGVTRFPSADNKGTVSLSKVPSVLYYDQEGSLKAVGAEVLSESIKEKAADQQWVKAEWFKLHLRPKRDEKDGGDAIPPLPPNKTFEDVLADYLRYLNECTLRFIEHAHGATIWESLSSSLNPSPDDAGRYQPGQGTVYVLSHPNGWQGFQQQSYATAACKAGLLPDDPEVLYERLHFVTEGEASLHWASETIGSGSAMKKGTGFTVIDAGGGTIDVSSYRRKKKASEERGVFEEIASPTCYFQGSVLVTVRARAFLKERLIDSEYYDDLDDILHAFDDTTKLNFRDPNDPQFVKFGGVGDNDEDVGIRFGQLRLKGEEVAALFKPAIDCIHNAVVEQCKLANKRISHVVLVGGFVNNDYLYERVKDALASVSVKVHRVDNLPNKAVANGAASYYLDHFVRARLSKVAYGFFGPITYKPKFRSHRKQHARPDGYYENDDGAVVLPHYFAEMLAKNVKVSEFKETRKSVYARNSSKFEGGMDVIVPIWCYNGKQTGERFFDDDKESYTKAFSVVVDASRVPVTECEVKGVKTWMFRAFIVLYFGLPAIKADLAWSEDGVEKRCPAKIVYDMPSYGNLDIVTASYGSIAKETNNAVTIETL
ncbi:hypothetical protein CVT24_002945 [Panaeolus cyanescens]|uniref:Uncharacterized protein n=1 Tax=Panaeolus cyanescens TaxID=181874 RepID=A0A409VP74_9AGAR|nr:hypothetical protein CVT24_002945 [Panaeolus cyanescens]